MRTLSVGDLIPPGTYGVHSRFARALNFTDGRFLVALVTPAVGAGPLNVVVDALPGEASRLEVTAAGLRLDGGLLPAGPRFDSRWRPGPPAAGIPERLARLRTRLLAAASEQSTAFLLDPAPAEARGFQGAYRSQMARGAAALFGQDPAEGARQLRGRGPGLTPGGDDLLAGHLFGLRARAHLGERGLAGRVRAVHRASVGTNPFSNTFLALARLGRPFDRLKGLLDTLVQGGNVDRATDGLLAVGASSGADLATGLHLTLSKGDITWR